MHFIWKHIMSRYFQLLCFRCKKLFRRNICIKAFLECGAYQYKGREGSRILSKSKYAMICIFQFGNFMQKSYCQGYFYETNIYISILFSFHVIEDEMFLYPNKYGNTNKLFPSWYINHISSFSGKIPSIAAYVGYDIEFLGIIYSTTFHTIFSRESS